MWTLAFWKATAERAIKSAAGALLVAWIAGPNGLVSVWQIDLRESLGFALGMGIVSVLMSLVSAPIGSGGPSLTGETLSSQVAAERLDSGAVVAGPAAAQADGTPVVVTTTPAGEV